MFFWSGMGTGKNLICPVNANKIPFAPHSFLIHYISGSSRHHSRNRKHSIMVNTILVQGQSIRTDWINKIERGTDKETTTCTIWLSIGPIGVYAFKGKDAESALELLANHSALEASS